MKTRYSRRGLLSAGGAISVVSLSGALGGCAWLSTDPQGSSPASGARAKGRQAPELAERVDAGDLEPVEERLPDEPAVVEPVDEIGQYGGTWRSALLGTADSGYVFAMAGYENLICWAPQWTGATGESELVPNVAERFEANDDATEFTFWLRAGMRWSDGHPFTVDDVIFAIEDVLQNEELYPVPPDSVSIDGELATVSKVDDLAFTITFPSRAGMFLHGLAHPLGAVLTKFPKHYLEPFHPAYNDAIDDAVRSAGMADWVELFTAKSGLTWDYATNAELPSLWAWQVTTPFGDGQQVVLERNPYYWKVDPDGSQLPYIDRIVFDVVNETEVMLTKSLAGDIDLEAGPNTRFTSPGNKPVLAREREAADFRFIDVDETRMNVMCIYFNMTHEDATKREIFTNRDFRIALSHAINREELIDATMQRQGEPYQVAPLPDSPFYDEELAAQFLDYDVDRANELLDQSFPERNGDGIRLGPTGEPIRFTLDFVPEFRAEWADMVELIRGYWLEVGIDANLRSADRSLFDERKNANQHDAGVWHGDGGLDVLQQPKNYFPSGNGSLFGVAWADWYTSGGDSGMEPPSEAQRQMRLFDELSASGDADEQAQLMRELLTIAKEQFYAIGIARETEKYFIASNRLRNLPDPMLQGWTYPTPGPTRPEQYFLTS